MKTLTRYLTFHLQTKTGFFNMTSQVEEVVQKSGVKDGMVLMELGEYPFSKRYGWLQDKYGLSWQLIYTPYRCIILVCPLRS